MTALFRYLFVYYARSHRYLAPFLAYVGAILFIYSQVPNPVMDSYAFTAMWTFVIAAWLSYGFIDLEHEAQRFVTIVHSRSIAKYDAVKFSILGTVTALMSIFAVVYPIVFNKFDRTPEAPEVGIALLAHLVLAWLGIACAAFFTERWAASRPLALLGLLLVIALSLPARPLRRGAGGENGLAARLLGGLFDGARRLVYSPVEQTSFLRDPFLTLPGPGDKIS